MYSSGYSTHYTVSGIERVVVFRRAELIVEFLRNPLNYFLLFCLQKKKVFSFNLHLQFFSNNLFRERPPIESYDRDDPSLRLRSKAVVDRDKICAIVIHHTARGSNYKGENIAKKNLANCWYFAKGQDRTRQSHYHGLGTVPSRVE